MTRPLGNRAKRRALFLGAGFVLAAWPFAADAQQPGKLRRVGFMRVGAPPPGFIEPFRFQLRVLGLIEGQNLAIEFGLAENAAQLPDVAKDLVSRKVDVIVASGTPSVVPARNATSATSIPVVFVAALDPVAAGVAKSLARPGGNVTGVSAVFADVTGKRVQLLRELLPQLSRTAVLVRAGSPATAQYVREAESAAAKLRMELHVLAVRDPSELEAAFGSSHRASALLVADDAMFTAHRGRIAQLALKHRLPSAYGFSEMVEVGGLLAYGPHYGDLYRLAAVQVHEILKGAKPADLPIEQPTKFELIINLKTAMALGLEVPPSILARADEVIE
ncbi:MAG: ABC transporter substrate-binding protein [Reyranella sp.]|nr:ABC transporter substrate-binding protein [Reyranella sp.]